MKLYMKQKVFSWRERFFVKDEAGNDRYSIEGEILSVGRKLHIKNIAGEQVGFIHQKLIAFTPRFFVEIDGREVCEIIKEIRLFKKSYRIEGLPWHLDGNFMGREYSLSSGDGPVMHLTQKMFSWGDSYELDITDPKDEVLCLCIAMAVECVLQEEEDAESDAIEVNSRLRK